MEKLDAFFEANLFPMDPPPAYGLFHILYTLLGFALCAIVAWKMRKTSDRATRWVLFSIGLVLAISEIYKQLLYYFAIQQNSYHWGEFPFQLCSIPMYLCLIAPWLKNQKLQRGMYSFMVLYNLLGGAIAFAEPSGLLQNYWFLTVHSLIWHMLLVFIGLFLCFSRRGGITPADYKMATRIFLFLCAIAFFLNLTVQNIFGKHMNMFFVGPGNSPIIVFKQISQMFGWYISTLIYIPTVCLGAYLIFCLIRLFHRQTC